MLKLRDLDLRNKTVFLRVDFNVPLDKNLAITSDARIKAALPTLNYLLDQGAKVVAASHLGRPKGQILPQFSLKPVAERLSRRLSREVFLAPDVIGTRVDKLKSDLLNGQILLLENLRFYTEETSNDRDFARELAKEIDCYVNDAFGACHRAHASVVAITEFIKKAAAGFLVEKEVRFLNKLIHNPDKPFVAILGGAKVSDKIPVIENLLTKADAILIGGAMAYTFFAAQGYGVGQSLVDKDKFELANQILIKAKEKGVNLQLPQDHIVSLSMDDQTPIQIIESFPIPSELMALDIGPKTVKAYSDIIHSAKTVLWNGPMGVFEIDPFSEGTTQIAKAVAASESLSIVGGGDSVSAVQKAGVSDLISHISTGGGASLEYIAKESLPGIDVLLEQQK
ncbi:MAG: phosphoglycerate kinase [Candidatus Aminicenantes bacterium]|nr:phosphoglycerate kinase [Candidatus Aminicenantes bacterium]